MDLKQIPFDQYQRYEITRQIIEEYKAFSNKKTLKILDVGGYFKNKYQQDWLPISNFMPNDYTIVLDVVDCSLDNYVRGDGKNLPFDDSSFDFVVTNDTLEHIEIGKRTGFINELLRVSNNKVVITAPFYNEVNEMFEKMLYEFIVNVLNAEHNMLKEHIENGLPKMEEINEILDELGYEHFVFSSGNSYNWFMMMIIKHYLMSMSHTSNLDRLIDRYYNDNVFKLDQNSLPSYRKVVVLSKINDSFIIHLRESFLNANEKTDARYNSEILNVVQTIFQLVNMKKENEKHLKIINKNITHETASPRINKKTTISYRFTCSQVNLCKISLLPATYMQKVNGKMFFELYDLEDNKMIYNQIIDLSTVEDNEWLNVEFPPIFVSGNHSFEVVLRCPDLKDENGISIWYNTLTNETLGQTFFNNEKVNGNLCVKIYCREYNSSDKYQILYEDMHQRYNDLKIKYRNLLLEKKELEVILSEIDND
jgi:hypothetical protein